MPAIARTLMTNPQLLLMDEPSEGLAPLIVREVGNIICQLAFGYGGRSIDREVRQEYNISLY